MEDWHGQLDDTEVACTVLESLTTCRTLYSFAADSQPWIKDTVSRWRPGRHLQQGATSEQHTRATQHIKIVQLGVEEVPGTTYLRALA